MSTRTKFVAVLSLMGATLVPVSSAAAADVITEDVTHTLQDGCHDYDVPLEASMAGATGWEIDVTLYAPSGAVSAGGQDAGDGDSLSGVMPFYICDFEGVGTYRYDGTFTWTNADASEVTETFTGELRMVPQRTRSYLAVSDRTPRVRELVKLKLRSQQETPSGWIANAGEYVAVESRCGRENWSRLPGSKVLTNSRGRATLGIKLRTRQACNVRTVTLKAANSAVSRSAAVKIRAH